MTTYIQTFTGRKFYSLEANINDIDLEDIAHSLSMLCRFNGHTKTFYSVAEHSVMVSRLLAKRGYDRSIQLWGHMHDAVEAYLTDIPAPFKSSLYVDLPLSTSRKERLPFAEAERRIMNLIIRKYDLSPASEPTCVKEADIAMGYREAQLLIKDSHIWIDKSRAAMTDIYCWSPAVAKKVFLSEFNYLDK
jgi:hypothetical protein